MKKKLTSLLAAIYYEWTRWRALRRRHWAYQIPRAELVVHEREHGHRIGAHMWEN